MQPQQTLPNHSPIVRYANPTEYMVDIMSVSSSTKPIDDLVAIQNLASSTSSSSSSSPQVTDSVAAKLFKEQVSDIVVKCLARYMKEGKIVSKDEFKYLARKLTHACIEKEKKQGNTTSMDQDVKKKIRKFVDDYQTSKNGTQ